LNKVRYEIDFRLCMYCGLCAEACPYEAIQVGGTFEDAVYTFDHMYKDKHDLTDLAQQYLRDHEFTYPNGQKAPFGNERAEAVSNSTRGKGSQISRSMVAP